jgi:hypothetical protein
VRRGDDYRQRWPGGSVGLSLDYQSAWLCSHPERGQRKCIDGGPPVERWRCLNTSLEEWQFVNDGHQNFQIVSQASGLCLAQVASHANGAPVMEQNCAQVRSQLWHAINGTTVGGSDFQLLNLSSGQCLDLENGDTSDGVPMQVWDCNIITDNQRWHEL